MLPTFEATHPEMFSMLDLKGDQDEIHSYDQSMVEKCLTPYLPSTRLFLSWQDHVPHAPLVFSLNGKRVTLLPSTPLPFQWNNTHHF